MPKTGERRGSALIMVMLVVASITTIIFATQRIALVQFSQSVREEDNLAAYYAAKAGVEDGLLRYHFDRNVQTEKDSIFRFDLTSAATPDSLGTVPYEIPSNTPITDGVDNDFDPSHQYYDLSISYKTKSINIDVNGDGNPVFNSIIAKDDLLTLTGFPEDEADPYFLRYVFKFDPNCNPADLQQARVTLQQVSTLNDGTETSGQVIAQYSPSLEDGAYDSMNFGNLQIYERSGYLTSSIRVRAYYCNVQYAFITTTGSLDSGTDNNIGPEFDGLTTEILSTGYFGGAKRTLVAAVDRQTGDLIGIFDFLLYSGGNTGTIRR